MDGSLLFTSDTETRGERRRSVAGCQHIRLGLMPDRRGGPQIGARTRSLARSVCDTRDETERDTDASNAERTDTSSDSAAPATDPAEPTDDASGGFVSARERVPRDDVFGQHPDRQVLVVGDTVVGRTLACLLRRAGYDPLLAADPEAAVESRLTHLWPPAQQVLDAIGVWSAVSDSRTTLDDVAIQGPTIDQGPTRLSTDDAATDGRLPAIVETQALRGVLEGRLPENRDEHPRTVAALSRTADGLLVDFDDGVQELFDVVVCAGAGGASLRAEDRAPRNDRTLLQYEAALEDAQTSGNELRELWRPDCLAQYIPPASGAGPVLRITTTNRDATARLEHEDLAALGGVEPGDSVAELDEIGPASVRQVGLQAAELGPSRWGTSRMAFCGPAACPVAPASGSRTSLGVEDALAFVSKLAHGSESVTAVVDAYATERAQRLATVRQGAVAAQATHSYPAPSPSDSSLGRLGLLRSVALGTVLDPALAALQRDGVG